MPQVSETVVTVPIRSFSARCDTESRVVRSDIVLHDIVPGVRNVHTKRKGTVQYGTSCYQDFVPATVPLSFVRGLKRCNLDYVHVTVH